MQDLIFRFTVNHLADAFIQSHLQMWRAIKPIIGQQYASAATTLLEEKILHRTLKGSISTTYLEPLKSSIHS